MTTKESTPRKIAVHLRDVCRHFGEVKAVDHVNLDILDGEFFSMLGPSGSGKTTCLRLIAGFEQPTSGSILLHEQEMAGVPPYQRDVNTVFQDYALFPHMTIGENVAYGLMIRKVATEERKRRVSEILDLVRLPGIQDRKPSQLSGGQRQRVALARALVNRPSVLLLDEPLGALDLKLRQEMQVELKMIQQQVGITFIFVTHDQEEALTMSDRIAVFNRGQVEQIGTPAEIYERPTTGFVAGFVGTSNLISGKAAERLFGDAKMHTIRPEKIHLVTPDAPDDRNTPSVNGRVRDVIYLGMYTRYLVESEVGYDFIVIQQNAVETPQELQATKGNRVKLQWNKSSVRAVEG